MQVADGRRLWDASSGQCLKTFDNDTNSPVYVKDEIDRNETDYQVICRIHPFINLPFLINPLIRLTYIQHPHLHRPQDISTRILRIRAIPMSSNRFRLHETPETRIRLCRIDERRRNTKGRSVVGQWI